MKALLLGALLGAVVALDPVATTYLLRDLPWLHQLPYLLSITVALALGLAFVAQGHVGGVATTVIRDYWRYFPLFFLLAYQFTGVTAGSLDLTDICIAVFLMLFLAGLFVHRDQRFVSTPFNMLHLAFGICLALSLASYFSLTQFVKAFKPLILFFLLVNFLPRENLMRTFLRWLVVLGMLSAAFGLLQEVVWATARIPLSLVSAKDIQMMIEPHFGVPVFRVPGMMTGYRVFGLYLATAMIVAASALLGRAEDAFLPRRWLIIGLCLMAPALGLTFAQDMLIGTCMALPLLFIMYRPNRRVPMALAAGLVGALALVTVIAVMPGNLEKAVDLTRTIPATQIERIRLDRDSIEGFVHGPYFWTGRGVGAGHRYTAHSRRWKAHNSYIVVAAEVGVVGLVIYLLVFGLALVRAVTLNLIVKDGPYLPLVRSLPPIMTLVLFGTQFESAYLEMFYWVIFAMIEAMWILARRPPVATSGSSSATSG